MYQVKEIGSIVADLLSRWENSTQQIRKLGNLVKNHRWVDFPEVYFDIDWNI